MKLTLIISAFFILFLGCKLLSNSHYAVCTGNVKLMEKATPIEFGNNTVLRELDRGDSLLVIDGGYGKDFVFYQVRYMDEDGYVFLHDSIKGLSKP